jgi:hypothetical protein
VAGHRAALATPDFHMPLDYRNYLLAPLNMEMCLRSLESQLKLSEPVVTSGFGGSHGLMFVHVHQA